MIVEHTATIHEAETMKTNKQWWSWAVMVASLALLLQLPGTAKAQDEDQDQNYQDPSSRVARLNYSQGSVSFQPGGENDWVTAVPNRPLVTGDNLWADENSRAEVHIGSTAIRLGPKTGITLLEVSDRATQIRLAQGSLFVRVRHVDDEDTYEVDTPNIAFTVLQPGEYRVDVDPDGNRTDVTVWRGRGEANGGGFSYTVVGDQHASFTGTDHLDYDLGRAGDRDDFDDWAFERDAREDRADSANYVSREMTGYEDLDDYGSWSYVAGYGTCWRPVGVAVGWAPYRFGHWVWVGPWGWTWVEDEPWGFAPFHYGRWAFVSGGWFWVPGPVYVRPVWAPALVAWVGGAPGFRFSAGVGVGWFPLGPGEVFVPGYRVSRGYVNNVNITNTTVSVTKITNVYNTTIVNRSTTINNITYVNQHVNGAVTVVSHDAFVNARPVAQNVMRVEPRELEAAPVTHMAAAEPVRASVVGAGRPVPVKPPAAAISRLVVAQRTPAPMPRSFEQRQAQAGGHLNQPPLVRQAPPSRPAPVNEAPRQQSQEGFKPFGPPSGGNNQAKPQPRVLEEQGTPEPQSRTAQPPENRSVQPENRNAQPENRNAQPVRPPQREEAKPQPEPHPLVRPAPPVQERNQQQQQEEEQKFRNWQQQRPTPPPPPQRQQNSRPPEPKPEKPSKPKGR